jgi:hypothetical protein
MVLLGFTKLKDKLLDGSKTQTIRKPRKIPLKVGDKLYIYWKLRTKQCQKLGEAKVTKIVRKCVAAMTHQDAVLDGFTSLQELALALYAMHPDVNEFSEFDIITFEWTKREV